MGNEVSSRTGGQPSSSKPAKMRYSQLFKSIAGIVGGSEVSPTPIPQFAFDSSAQPAKPAMKHATGSGSSNNHNRSTDMYPSVLDSPTHTAPVQGYNNRQDGATPCIACWAPYPWWVSSQFSPRSPDHPTLLPASTAPCGCIARFLPGAPLAPAIHLPALCLHCSSPGKQWRRQDVVHALSNTR